MNNYLNLLNDVLENGEKVQSRAGPCIKVFHRILTFDLANGMFPIVTTKYIPFKSVVAELLWFLKGKTNISWLHEHNVTIWDEWADENGDLGQIYGHQWRNLSVDQISQLVYNIKNDPESRRLIVNSWNVENINKMRLPPCHYALECYVRDSTFLDLKWHQRSVDVMLGLPFNISSYALLLQILSKECCLVPGRLIGDLGNVHIYNNHIEGAKEQLLRFPNELPTLSFSKRNIFDYEVDDFKLNNYTYHPHIKLEVAI